MKISLLFASLAHNPIQTKLLIPGTISLSTNATPSTFAKKEFPFSKGILIKIPNVKSLTSPESLQPVKSNIPQIVELK